MGSRLLCEAFIRQKSEEMQIPFDHALAAAALEEAVRRISESDYAIVFWLKNSMKLGIEKYDEKIDLSLSYYIKDKQKLHYNKTEICNVFAEIFRNLKQEAFQWTYQIREDNNLIYADLVAAIAEIKIPVKIKLERILDECAVPNKREVTLFWNRGQKIRVRCYPNEYIIAEKFLDIIEKLELLNDMSGYMDIYEILEHEIVSGRKVWELLSMGCKVHGIQTTEQRFQLLISYQTNKYMKKKWKAYLRHQKKTTPAWDEVIYKIEAFFTNIWTSLCRNIIYLGDWMPELGRFID